MLLARGGVGIYIYIYMHKYKLYNKIKYEMRKAASHCSKMACLTIQKVDEQTMTVPSHKLKEIIFLV